MTTRSKPPPKSRATKARETAADKLEAERWPEVAGKVAAARASVAKGKARKWDLDRTLAESERRRRAKAAAE